MSAVVFHHPLHTSCTPPAHNHPSSAHPSQQRVAPRTLPSPASSVSSSSRAKFPGFPLRCIYHCPTLPSPSGCLPFSTKLPGLPKKGPSFAAQPCGCSSGRGTLLCGAPEGTTTVWRFPPLAGVSPLRRQQPSTSRLAAAGQPSNPKKEDKLVVEGLITELLPNCMFRVRLDNGDVILGYVSGKMRTKMVRVLVGDRVKIEVSRYDSTRGRIVYRLRSKSSTD